MGNYKRFRVIMLVILCQFILTACGEDIPFPETTLTDEELENKFYYNLIESDEARLTYKELYEGLMARSDDIYVHNNNEVSVGDMLMYIDYDYPEIFWCDAETEVTYKSVEEWGTEYTIISPDYGYSLEEVSAMKQEIENETQECIEKCEEEKSDYKKVKYIYEYLVDTVEYKDSPNDQNIYSALVSKETVCAGYAKSVQYLLEEVGVKCYTVGGRAQGEDEAYESHAWNIVNCDGEYYYVDVTWADPKGQEENVQSLMIYDYLCCSEEQLADTHERDYDDKLPECNSEEFNYYRMHDMFYDSCDKDEILTAMKEDIAEKEEHSTFKFAEKEGYEEALEEVKGKLLDDALQYLMQYHGMQKSSCTYDYDDMLYKINVYWSYE